MGIRAGSCFDLGIHVAVAEAELSRYSPDGESKYLKVARKAVGFAIDSARTLNSNGISVNRGQLDALLNGMNTHKGNSEAQRKALWTQARQARIDYSETINGFDQTNGTRYGPAFDLGSAFGLGEAQASFWGIGPNALIDASAKLAIQALSAAKPFAAKLKPSYPGVDPAGIDWVGKGYGDPDRTGNGFKAAYQRFVQQRQLMHDSLHNLNP